MVSEDELNVGDFRQIDSFFMDSSEKELEFTNDLLTSLQRIGIRSMKSIGI